MRPIRNIISTFAMMSMASLCGQTHTPDVLICYGKLDADVIKNYQYVIIEPDEFNALSIDSILNNNNALVLGYISMGEVSTYRSYYKDIEGRTLGKNEIWDSFYLDLSDEATRQALLNVVDDIYQKGFSGLFLDTIDVFGPWGNSPEQADELASLIAEFKRRYPAFHIMQNSGLELLPKTRPFINSLALESIFTDFDFDNMSYALRKRREAKKIAKRLNSVKKEYGLDIVAIEYVDTKRKYRKVTRRLRANEWDFFIGQIALDSIPFFR